MEIFTAEGLWVLLQVIGIDLVLAGDNAIVIGMAAAGLPAQQRNRVILVGIVAATVLRVGFALIASWLLGFGGTLLIGGAILLLWVCWRMWRELREGHGTDQVDGQEALEGQDLDADGRVAGGAPRKTFGQAALQIVLADVSMSLDNVLAVAGAAHDHPTILLIGLVLSVALMGLASTFVARLLNRFRWIAYVGVALILFVALRMLWHGYEQLRHPEAPEPAAATAAEG